MKLLSFRICVLCSIALVLLPFSRPATAQSYCPGCEAGDCKISDFRCVIYGAVTDRTCHGILLPRAVVLSSLGLLTG